MIQIRYFNNTQYCTIQNDKDLKSFFISNSDSHNLSSTFENVPKIQIVLGKP
jgi:hypothetical protein